MPEQTRAWLQKCKAVILDLDGVVYLTNKMIPGADTTINTFYQKGLEVFFLTNNSTASRNDVLRKLRKLGVPVHSEEQILSSAYLIGKRMEMDGVRGRVLTFGSAGMKEEIAKIAQLEPVTIIGTQCYQVEVDLMHQPVNAIAVAFDVHFNYMKLMQIVAAYTKFKCPIYFSNCDKKFPGPTLVLPGAGSVFESIIHSLPADANYRFCGKPEPYIGELIQQKLGITREKMVMVGDNLYTDIRFGQNCGIPAVLIQSGVYSDEEIARSGITPTLVLPALAAFPTEELAAH